MIQAHCPFHQRLSGELLWLATVLVLEICQDISNGLPVKRVLS